MCVRRDGVEAEQGPNRTSSTAYWTVDDPVMRWNRLNPEASNFYHISVGRISPTNFPKGALGKGFIIM